MCFTQEVQVFKGPRDHLVPKIHVRVYLDQGDYQGQMAIQDIQVGVYWSHVMYFTVNSRRKWKIKDLWLTII